MAPDGDLRGKIQRDGISPCRLSCLCYGLIERFAQAVNNKGIFMSVEVGGLLGLIWLVIIIWAIIKCAQSNAGPVAKILWILLLLFMPLLGLILWLLLGPKS